MPSRELQQPSADSLVSPAWESSPWQPEDRVVVELESASKEPPMRLADDHMIELQESDSLRRAH
jgi:hypothetical protein